MFGLLEWLLFFFSFLPNHSSFLSLPCLLSVSFSSLLTNNTTHTDWTGGHGHKVSQHIEPLPFSHSLHHFPSFAFLCPSICPLISPSLLPLHHVVYVEKHLMPILLLFHKHTTHTGMDGMGDIICTALPQHTITTLSLSHQTPTTTQTTKNHRCITLMDMKMNKVWMEL